MNARCNTRVPSDSARQRKCFVPRVVMAHCFGLRPVVFWLILSDVLFDKSMARQREEAQYLTSIAGIIKIVSFRLTAISGTSRLGVSNHILS